MSTDAKVIVTSEDKINDLLQESIRDILQSELPPVIKKPEEKIF